MGLAVTTTAHNEQNKSPRDLAKTRPFTAPVPKQRHLHLGGLLNPYKAKRTADNLESDIAKALTQGRGDESILSCKEKPLPQTYRETISGRFTSHRGPDYYPNASAVC